MGGAYPAVVQAAQARLWQHPTAQLPDWLPMTYVHWLPRAYDVAAQFTASKKGRTNVYLVLLDYADRRGDDHGVYVGMSRYPAALRFDQHKAGIRAAGAVLLNFRANAHVVDAVIGLSVAYKAFENLGGFRVFGLAPDPRGAVLGFGLVHGLGLATKLQELSLSRTGLAANMVGFNVGVELGQLVALTLMVLLFALWRSTSSFQRSAQAANVALLTAGFVLAGYQMAGYFLT